MVKRLGLILAALMLIVGTYILLYPALNGAALEHKAENAAEEFLERLPTPAPQGTSNTTAPPLRPTPMPYQELYAAMLEYNQALYLQSQSDLSDPWAYEAAGFDLEAFGMGNAVVGVLNIPALELEMPIYLGATEDNLAAGTAVLGQTSLPIGGENTNCVIAGHRGWCGAAYFQYLNELETGDSVTITNLWGTLQYSVTELRIIQPNEISEVLIQPGKDLITLLTCHPYASGGKCRLLVLCERTG